MELVAAYEDDLLHDPFWFQDGEGRCLGIGGFGECGDTLWRVRRREGRRGRTQSDSSSIKKRQRKQTGEKVGENTVCVWPFFCERDSTFLQSRGYDGFEIREEDGFALELVDVDEYMYGGHTTKQRRRRRRFLRLEEDKNRHEAECLVAVPSEGSPSLQLGSCNSEQAWLWHMNRDGVLVRGLTRNERRKINRRRWVGPPTTVGSRPGLHSMTDVDVDMLCLHTVNSTGASLLPCQADQKYASSDNNFLVGFSLVRYPSASHRMTLNSPNGEEVSPWITLEGSLSKQSDNKQPSENITSESSTSPHMPSSRTHASNAKQRHLEVKSNRNMLHTGLDQGSTRKSISARTSASHIRDAPSTTVDGLPFHSQHSDESKSQASHDEKNLGKIKTALLHKEKPQKRTKHSGDKEDGIIGNPEASAHHRPIKIPVHPYIEASKDGIWVDPLTSLEYPTDLCTYLGHTKQEAGRHTLMGVGQYFRTAFNIKVRVLLRIFHSFNSSC